MCKPLGCIGYLLHNISFSVVFKDMVQLLFAFNLVLLQLSLKSLLLFYFFFSDTEISFQVYEKVWLLNQQQSTLQFFMFFH